MNWIYNKGFDTWFTGTASDGAGVFQDIDTLWYGNVCHPSILDIWGYGPYNTKEEVVTRVEKELEELRKILI